MAADLAFALSEFFSAIGYTDEVVAQVATGKKSAALEDEEKALAKLETFMGKFSHLENAANELRKRAKASQQSKAMEAAIGMSWDEYFDGLLSEIQKAKKSVSRFVARDKELGMKFIEKGDV